MAEQTRIELDGGAEATVEFPLRYERCKGCKAKILWGRTIKNKKWIPIRYVEDENKFIAHFADCPKANDFRKDQLKMEEDEGKV